jgi:hypothetical protein
LTPFEHVNTIVNIIGFGLSLPNRILGLEVARPERDRGIDLIAYLDLDERVGSFLACPIQMKAATGAVFSLDPKYAKFPRLILAYVWGLGDSSQTRCFALTYAEALGIANEMGWTRTASWLTGGRNKRPGYSTTAPSGRLRALLTAFQMNPEKWRLKVTKI